MLEPQTPDAVRAAGHWAPPGPRSASDCSRPGPHLLLEEGFWGAPTRTATERWQVVHPDTAQVERYAISTCSRDVQELVDPLATIGFEEIRTRPSLTDDDAGADPGLFGMTAIRRA